MANSPLSPELVAFGARYTPAQPQPGQNVWRLIEASGPMDIGGNHSIFVEVLGLDGQRAVGVRMRFWNGGNSFKASEPKPGSNYAIDFPIFAAGNAYGVAVADGLPSDEIFGMGLVPFEPHKSYHLTFRLVPASSSGSPPGAVVVPPAPGPSDNEPKTALEAIERAQYYLDQARGLL